MAEDKFLVICSSTTDMLRAGHALQVSGINYLPVPVPGELGSVCATALQINAAEVATAAEVLKAGKIGVIAIKSLPPTPLTELAQKLDKKKLSSGIGRVLRKVEEGTQLIREDIINLLQVDNEKEMEALFQAGDLMRKRVVGDRVDIRACLEFSNYCRKNCLYCGLRRDNKKIKRYRMAAGEIIEAAMRVHRAGIKTLILQSGEDAAFSADKICSLIKEIKSRTGLRITLSIGERSRAEYEAFREAGANNYLLKIETANRKLYSYLHPGERWETRAEHTGWLKELGYITGSGNIIGLPGQTVEDLAEDICYFKDAGVHMLGIGPFIPAPDTPLAVFPTGTAEMTWKFIAAARLVIKNVFIPSTTALATLKREAQKKGLAVGANTIMIIVTPEEYRKNYLIYPNKLAVDINWTLEMIRGLDRMAPVDIKSGSLI